MSPPNELLLNPRLPAAQLALYEAAWLSLVEPAFKNQIGIATSGSTGEMGRLILLSRAALEASARAVNERFLSDANDVWFKSLPDFHVGGLGIRIRARLSGASVFEDPSPKWDARTFAIDTERARATLISLVPTQVFDLVQAQVRAPESVRAVIVGGGRLEENLRLRACELGWPCLPSYGMTETCSQIATALSTHDPSLILLSHAEARTAADGRLQVRGSSLLSAQIVFDSKNAATLVDPKVDGWFTAEDHAKVVGTALTIEGRTSDFVKISGEGVVIARLEERLDRLKLETGFRGDIALLAAKDARLGATLVLIATEDATTLIDLFNSGVAPFERIKRTERVESIPRSALGKLQRGLALRQIGLEPVTN